MFSNTKKQQKQEENVLCSVLLVFNLALLAVFIFFCFAR